MRANALLVLCIVLQVGCAPMSMPDEQFKSVEAVVPAIARDFSACDLDALLKHYSPDAEFVSPSTPKPLVGHAALRDHFAGACKGSVRPIMKVEAQRVRMLSAESAVVTGAYSFGRTDRPGDRPWPAYFVVTVARADTGWRVVSQATLAKPEG
jgi:uncharacterized protein (TIGR02246 family)